MGLDSIGLGFIVRYRVLEINLRMIVYSNYSGFHQTLITPCILGGLDPYYKVSYDHNYSIWDAVGRLGGIQDSPYFPKP